jgi:hypothetical protein
MGTRWSLVLAAVLGVDGVENLLDRGGVDAFGARCSVAGRCLAFVEEDGGRGRRGYGEAGEEEKRR